MRSRCGCSRGRGMTPGFTPAAAGAFR
jgi:hypothetical protein